MFKSKKNRDSALLVFMAIVMVVFLLYIFLPSNIKPEKKKEPVSAKKMSGIKKPAPEKTASTGTDRLIELRSKIQEYFNEVNNGDRAINQIPAKEIESILFSPSLKDLEEEIGRALKYRFRDMNRALDAFRNTDLTGAEKFDIFIALFLIKSAAEDITGISMNLTTEEITDLLNLSPYSLIENEIEENYQSVPALIYADILVSKADIFSPGKDIRAFSKMISGIGDISNMQHINSIKDIFDISSELRHFTFSWEEEDFLFANDKGIYHNVPVRKRKFFKLQFLNFPDAGKGGDHTWIKELIAADKGDIELIDLKVADETPGEQYSAKSLIYQEGTSRFTVIMDSPTISSERGYVSIMLREKMDRVSSENKVINFAEKLYSKKDFREKLLDFGRFLCRISSVF